MKSKILAVIIAFLVVPLLLGCVSSSKYNALVSERDTLIQQAVSCNATCEELVGEVDRWGVIIEANNQEINELRARNRTLQDDNYSLSSQCRTLEQESSTLDQENSNLKAQYGTLQELGSEYRELQQEYQELQKEYQKLQEELKSAKQSVGMKVGDEPSRDLLYTKGNNQPIFLNNNPESRDPTYTELKEFLWSDNTESYKYIDRSPSVIGYTCGDYAEMLHNNAEEKGIRAAVAIISFQGTYSLHAMNAFSLADKKQLCFVDCTGTTEGWGNDKLAKLEIGKQIVFTTLEGTPFAGYWFRIHSSVLGYELFW